MSYICKRCMKKEVTREDGEPFVVATLENDLGTCSYCGVENWVHAVTNMPVLKIEGEELARIGLEKLEQEGHEELIRVGREVAESIPDEEFTPIVLKTGQETVDALEEVLEDIAEKSAVEETEIKVAEAIELKDARQAQIDALKAQLAELEK